MPISTNNSTTHVQADLTLPQLAVLVDKHFAAFQKFGRRTVEEAWQAGRYLLKAKGLVAHGGWLGWLDERGIEATLSSRLMNLNLGFPKILQIAKFETVQAALESAKKPHVSQASGENEWYTPPNIIEAAR